MVNNSESDWIYIAKTASLVCFFNQVRLKMHPKDSEIQHYTTQFVQLSFALVFLLHMNVIVSRITIYDRNIKTKTCLGGKF